MPAARLKKVRGRKTSSQRWLQRHLSDPYVAQSKQDGYRSRAAYKLLELDSKLKFLKRGALVIDLGNAPGGWTQVAVEKKAEVIGIDLLQTKSIPGATLLTGDITDEAEQEKIVAWLNGRLADVVMSDIAPNTTGIKNIDHLRLVGILESVIDFAKGVLKEGGTLVMKVFDGGTLQNMMADLKKTFKTVKHVKPPASRKDSKEFYLVAQGYLKKA